MCQHGLSQFWHVSAKLIMYQIHSGKFARLNLTPFQNLCVVTQFPVKDIDTKFEKQIKPYLLKVTSFHQILKFKRECKIQKYINLQKMQSIILQKIQGIKWKMKIHENLFILTLSYWHIYPRLILSRWYQTFVPVSISVLL